MVDQSKPLTSITKNSEHNMDGNHIIFIVMEKLIKSIPWDNIEKKYDLDKN